MNLTIIKLEILRLFRGKRVLFFGFGLPIFYYWVFAASLKANTKGHTFELQHGNLAAVLMVSIGMYLSATQIAQSGAGVSTDKMTGWLRTILLSPIKPWQYVSSRVIAGLAMSMVATGTLYIFAFATGARADGFAAIASFVLTLLVSIIFALLGLGMGYLLKSGTAQQVTPLLMLIFAFAGGVFIPSSTFSPFFKTVAEWSPLYGANSISLYPIVGGTFHMQWVINLVGWALVLGYFTLFTFKRSGERV